MVDLATLVGLQKRKPVRVTQVVIGNTGLVAEGCAELVSDLDIGVEVTWLQKIAATETVNIVRTLL